MDVQGANDDTTQHDADRRIEEHGSLHFTNRRRLTSVELGRLIFSAFTLLVEAHQHSPTRSYWLVDGTNTTQLPASLRCFLQQISGGQPLIKEM
jgi:hypothetical protein